MSGFDWPRVTSTWIDRRTPKKCDQCGKFCTDLYPIYCNPPEGGIDREVCDRCARLAS